MTPPSDRHLDSSADLESRISFLQIDADARNKLKKLKGVVQRELPKGLDRFYEKVRANPETKRFFSSENHMQSAKNAQAGHWDSISNGRFDKQYADRVNRIGSVHADIGLAPRWYIGGYGVLTDQLINGVVEEFWPKGGMFSKAKHGPDEVAAMLSALIRAIYLDMDLSISIYIDKAEEAKKKAQEEALAEQRRIIEGFGKAIARIAHQDLSVRIGDEIPEAKSEEVV